MLRALLGVPLLFLIVSLAACRTWARVEDNLAWTLVVPEKVHYGADLVFTVQARTANGEPADGVSFLWAVDWVNAEGARRGSGVRHKGRAFEPQDIRVKRSTGEALLRIYAYDSAGNVHQVAQKEFQVE